MSGLVDVLAAWDEDDEYPHRMTFVVLHPDTPLPAEAEVEAFFCPSFWVAPNSTSYSSDYYFNYPSPGDWHYLSLSDCDEDKATVAHSYLRRVRAGDTCMEFGIVGDDVVTPFLEKLQAGLYPAVPGVDAERGWAFTRLALWTKRAADVREFLATVERFLERMGGVVVAPEVLDLAGFRRVYLGE